MQTLEVVHHPHPALRWKSREVTKIDAGLKDMIAQMFDLMYAHKGIGLAANQVALPYRLFVINPTGDAAEKSEERVFINPQITRRNGSIEDEEGCLSLPEIFGHVSRAARIVVDAFDLSGQQFELNLADLPARVVQHEYDHIEGILFTDRLAATELAKLKPLLDDLELQFRNRQREGTVPSDQVLMSELKSLARERTRG
jgi:peptide deformylase